MGNYLPLYRPADTLTFDVTAPVIGGQAVEVGATNRSVAPAAAGTRKYVGVAGHDAAIGDKVTVEVGKVVHELTAAGAVALGAELESAGGNRVRTLTTGVRIGLALTAAADGAAVQVLQA